MVHVSTLGDARESMTPPSWRGADVLLVCALVPTQDPPYEMANLFRRGFNNLGKALRETGQALDQVGMECIGSDAHKELCECRLLSYLDNESRLARCDHPIQIGLSFVTRTTPSYCVTRQWPV
jgi:hypothetical protein